VKDTAHGLPLSLVDRHNVGLHGGASRELLLASVKDARVGSLSGMRHFMALGVRRISKRLFASGMGAYVRLFSSVDTDVALQGSALTERATATFVRALVRLLAVMSLEVAAKSKGRSKNLVTCIVRTGEVRLGGLGAHVGVNSDRVGGSHKRATSANQHGNAVHLGKPRDKEGTSICGGGRHTGVVDGVHVGCDALGGGRGVVDSGGYRRLKSGHGSNALRLHGHQQILHGHHELRGVHGDHILKHLCIDVVHLRRIDGHVAVGDLHVLLGEGHARELLGSKHWHRGGGGLGGEGLGEGVGLNLGRDSCRG